MSQPTHKEISIPWPGKSSINVILTSPSEGINQSTYGFLLGPGAGGDEQTPLLTAVAEHVARQGHFCARYRAKVPNLGHRVAMCTRVLEHLFHPVSGLHPQQGMFLGGHSMGSRVAGTIAAQMEGKPSTASAPTPSKKKTSAKDKKTPTAIASTSSSSTPSSSTGFPPGFIIGLVLFSYPLHTADNTKALRDQILYDIPSSVCTLFISGSKDTMCQPSIFEKVFRDMTSSSREAVQISGADHGLGFGSSKPALAQKKVLAEAIAEWTVEFMVESTQQQHNNATKNAPEVKLVVRKQAEMKSLEGEWTVAVSTVA